MEQNKAKSHLDYGERYQVFLLCEETESISSPLEDERGSLIRIANNFEI